jgi:hypothetical protein
MTHSSLLKRFALLLVGAVVASSCDTRLPTQPVGSLLDDVERPKVTFVVPGSVNNSVILGSPVAINVTATDNKGVTSISTTVRNGALIIASDTAAVSPSALSTTRNLTVAANKFKKGDVLVVKTTVQDVAQNTKVDSTIITVATPSIVFSSPAAFSKTNVGDSILVTATLHDAAGLKSVSFVGFSLRGNPTLGTQDTIIRYPIVIAPNATGFSGTVKDTTISRYLKVATPIDSVTDSLYIRGVVTSTLGGVDTARVALKVVRGPSVIFLQPVPGDSATPGAGITVSIRVIDPSGIVLAGMKATSAAGFPTPINDQQVTAYTNLPKDTVFTVTTAVPANAPPKGIITITPLATNSSGEGATTAPITIAVRAGTPPPPRVTQVIPPRLEVIDSVQVSALGSGIRYLGVQITDLTGAILLRDSVSVAAPFPSTAKATIPISLPSTVRGQRVLVKSFAYDVGGIGYSVQAGATNGTTNIGAALQDTSLIVFGRTYTLPGNRNGTIADIKVDETRGNVFLSNVNFGRLEVWQGGSTSFDPAGIVVGSQPWGMTFSRTAAAKDTMYVANSGGTNLSRVYIGGATVASMKEDLTNRLVTRASYMFRLTETRDQQTQKIRLSVSGPIIFSDRPQYVEQSAPGRLYISTKPTTQAPQGTVRWMDPAAAAPDERFILDFAFLGNDPNSWVVANVDAVTVTPAPATSLANDVLTICDHPSGSTAPATCVSSSGGIAATIATLQGTVPTTDVDYAVNVDVSSLGLTDTTYAASSGDGKWITFGEGHKSPVARNFILQDDGSVPSKFNYVSPSLNVVDLMTNSSDQIFGVALDKTGQTIGIHGTETAFSAVTVPFTQRLQGKKSTFATGAGIAFHPNADGTQTPQDSRLAFVSSNNGSIEAVDIAYYDFTRGALATKANLYGPLRATLPFPGDPANVVLKLFGVSSKGLVVIDVTAADLIPGP